jgi:hypothetical protein
MQAPCLQLAVNSLKEYHMRTLLTMPPPEWVLKKLEQVGHPSILMEPAGIEPDSEGMVCCQGLA